MSEVKDVKNFDPDIVEFFAKYSYDTAASEHFPTMEASTPYISCLILAIGVALTMAITRDS